MKVLLDECVPIQVRNALDGHEVITVQHMGWGGLANGELLDIAEKTGFDVIIIAERTCAISKTSRLVESRLWSFGQTTGRL